MDWNSGIRDPDELWKKMKEQLAANNTDAYYLLARRAEDLVDTYLDHYGLCSELGVAYGQKARDVNACRPGRKVAAIRSHRYHNLAAGIAANACKDVRIVPEGWEGQGAGCVDRQAAQVRALHEAAEVLLQLDWVTDSWKWQWISWSLAPVVQVMTTYDPAHLHLGEAYFNLDDLDRAEATWRQARELPNAAGNLDRCLLALRFRRAEKAGEAGEWSEVVRLLESQCDLSARELVVLGDAYQRLGDANRARATWEWALRCDPGAPGAEERLRNLKAA